MKRCPATYLTPEILGVAKAHNHKQSGLLPVAGGWLDQSATLMTALLIVDQEIASYGARK